MHVYTDVILQTSTFVNQSSQKLAFKKLTLPERHNRRPAAKTDASWEKCHARN